MIQGGDSGDSDTKERTQREPLFPDQPFGFQQSLFFLKKDFVLSSVHSPKVTTSQVSSCPCASSPTITSHPNPFIHANGQQNTSLKRQRCSISTPSGCSCEGAKCTFLTCTCPHRTQHQKAKNLAQTLALAGMCRLSRNSPASILATNALVFDYFVDTFLVGRTITPPLYLSLRDEKYVITNTKEGIPVATKLHYCTRVIGSAGNHKVVGFMTETECKVTVWDPQKSLYPQESFDINASTTDKFVCNARWIAAYNPRTHTIKIWSLADKREKGELKCAGNVLSMQVIENSLGCILKVVTSLSSLSMSSVITISDYALPNVNSGPMKQPITKDLSDSMDDIDDDDDEIHSLHLLEGAQYLVASKIAGSATVFNLETLDVAGRVGKLRSVVPVGGCSFATLDTGVARLYRIDSDGIKMVKELDNVADCAGSGGVLFVKQAFGNRIEALSSESGESLWTLAPDASKDFRGGQYIHSFPI